MGVGDSAAALVGVYLKNRGFAHSLPGLRRKTWEGSFGSLYHLHSLDNNDLFESIVERTPLCYAASTPEYALVLGMFLHVCAGWH